MFLYLILLLAPMAAAVASRVPGRWRGCIWLTILVTLVLFVGFRRQIGCDWNTYLLYLNRAAELPFWQAVALSDPGYMLLNWLVADLGLGLGFVYAACAAVLFTGLIQLVRREPYPALALIIATPVLVMIVGFGPVRQSVVVGLLMIALALYRSKRQRAAATLLLVGPLFHWMGVILLPLAVLMLWRGGVRAWQLTLTGLVLGVLAAAAHWVVPGIAGAGDAQGAWLRQVPTVISMIAALSLMAGGDRSQEEQKVLGFLCGIAALGIVSGFGSTVTMDRIGYFTLPLQLLALPRAVAALPARWRASGWSAVALFYLVLFFGWLTFTTQKPCFLPYRSYLIEQQFLIRDEAEPYWLGRELSGYHGDTGVDHPPY